MGLFKEWKIEDILSKLENKEISNNEMIQGEWVDYTILQALVNSETFPNKLEMAKKFIDLGCSTDQYNSSGTAISLAASNGNWDFVEFFLNYHKFGHRSDLNILISSSSSLDKEMFKNVLETKKINTNVTQYKGSHILHHLAEDDRFSDKILLLWELAPMTIPNPIHRKGYSPLTKAINGNNLDSALAISKNKDAKIIGELINPHALIDTELIDRYDGDFWNLESDLIDYAIANNKEHLLPNDVKDVFLF